MASKYSAFTLAEIMITLTIIGIISAIIVPVAINSKPDENVMKFKKAHNTLYQVIQTLISSDKYYLDGDLGIKADGELAENSYFCNSFADIVSSKKIVCSYNGTSQHRFVSLCTLASGGCISHYAEDNYGHATYYDRACKFSENAQTDNNDIGIKTTDNVYYFEASLEDFFGCIYGEDCTHYDSGWTTVEGKRLYNTSMDVVKFSTGIKTNRLYRPFCIDIDGINKGEDPFGYGISVKGKIIVGKRAREWLQKDIQGEN